MYIDLDITQVGTSLNHNWEIYSAKLRVKVSPTKGRSFGIKRIQKAENNEWNYSRPESLTKVNSKANLCFAPKI